MLIYRLENKDGIGPYQTSDLSPDAWQIHNHWMPRNPLWFEDESLGTNHPCDLETLLRRATKGSYRYGFSSIEQIVMWFDFEEIDRLYKLYFAVAIYEVEDSDVYRFKKQVIACKTDMKRKGRLTIDQIKKEFSLYTGISEEVGMEITPDLL